MKKLNWLLVFFLILSAMFVVGCSDDDDDNGNGNGPTDPPFEPEEADYFFSVMDMEDRDEFLIVVYEYEGDPITNLNLLINGSAVELENMYDVWMTTYSFNYAQTYNFNLSINRQDYDFNLKIPANLDVDWPDEYNPTEGMVVNWTLNPNENSMIQEFAGSSWIWHEDTWEYEIIDDKWVFLEPSVRSFSVPANWLSVQEEYDFALLEYNFLEENGLIAAAMEISGVTYGDDDDNLRQNLMFKFNEHVYRTITK
ncbi:MAG: hypothetical protein APR54_04805 [Candidatus Cloacimonas sp. SDB]|nr:MAG: hypothetical protein APR54_04805 [Candidatus Cloacimonas sp. SDB]